MKWLFYYPRLVLAQYLVTVIDQRIGDPAHHPAFRREAMPVEHPPLKQSRREVDKLAAVELFSICRCGIMQQVVPGAQAAQRLPKS